LSFGKNREGAKNEHKSKENPAKENREPASRSSYRFVRCLDGFIVLLDPAGKVHRLFQGGLELGGVPGRHRTADLAVGRARKKKVVSQKILLAALGEKRGEKREKLSLASLASPTSQ